ncbi:MAG: aspartate carbamoyltransferase regulatory subunit [Prevotellaceae bacterium]|nr:aspartate carbamoyltransferase regulatory subunit [Candidatus Minthosoma caballi]
MEHNKEQMMVAALENGSVIDHIPTDKLWTIAQLLNLDKCPEEVVIANNLESKVMTRKGLIKISGKFFSEEEISKLAVVCPNIRLTVIRNYEVTEKRQINLSDTIINIVKCANPVCITNNEPMKTYFNVKDLTTLKCRYCGKEQSLDSIKLK